MTSPDLGFDFDNTYAQLPDRFFAKLSPTSVSEPKLIKFNHKLAAELGLDSEAFSSPEAVSVLAGNDITQGSSPLAMAYAGQQFGSWNPQLGDGRAILLGEVLNKDGARFDVQLKGSGPTPFSRGGDGRAWLGPVMREYIVSEAMAALGVPTTRALAAVTTGENVIREAVLPGAILTRVAKGHIRVGTFQFFAARQDQEALQILLSYCIERFYPSAADEDNPPLAFLKLVMEAQANLVAKWMSIGFIHGVMNTDNVSIAGETIDYGPCAFMDEFHADRVFSSIDQQGRYAYSNQPRIAHWNMVQFAQALLPLFAETQEEAVALAQEAVNAFPALYATAYNQLMNAKIGLSLQDEADEKLVNDLLHLMMEGEADFTLTFRYLATDAEKFAGLFADKEGVDAWLERWNQRRERDDFSEADSTALMMRSNPAFIPRNHRIEQAIRAALEDDLEPFERLNKVLESPFTDQSDAEDLMLGPAPKEAVRYTFCGT